MLLQKIFALFKHFMPYINYAVCCLVFLYSGVHFFTYLHGTDSKVGVYTFDLALLMINIKNIDVFPLITLLFLISLLTFLYNLYRISVKGSSFFITLLNISFLSVFGNLNKLMSQQKLLLYSFMDKIDLGFFNIVTLRLTRSEEQFVKDCSLFIRKNPNSKFLTSDDYRILLDYVKSHLNQIDDVTQFVTSYLNKKCMTTKIVTPDVTLSWFEYLSPYFSADYYYAGYFIVAGTALLAGSVSFFYYGGGGSSGGGPSASASDVVSVVKIAAKIVSDSDSDSDTSDIIKDDNEDGLIPNKASSVFLDVVRRKVNFIPFKN